MSFQGVLIGQVGKEKSISLQRKNIFYVIHVVTTPAVYFLDELSIEMFSLKVFCLLGAQLVFCFIAPNAFRRPYINLKMSSNLNLVQLNLAEDFEIKDFLDKFAGLDIAGVYAISNVENKIVYVGASK